MDRGAESGVKPAQPGTALAKSIAAASRGWMSENCLLSADRVKCDIPSYKIRHSLSIPQKLLAESERRVDDTIACFLGALLVTKH